MDQREKKCQSKYVIYLALESFVGLRLLGGVSEADMSFPTEVGSD